MSFGWGVGDIIAVSRLALDVYTAYKDAPEHYRHISKEVRSLQIIINKAVQHFEHATLSGSDLKEGQEVLEGCRGVLEDLNSLIGKYKSLLASSKPRQVFKRVKLGGEDITALRVRLISNTVLLNGFIQSCEMQARLTDVLGLQRANSRVSISSITSFAGSVNTNAYKEFCRSLFQTGVTAEMIGQKEKEILDIFKPQNVAPGSQIDDSTTENQTQLPEIGGSSSVAPPTNSPAPIDENIAADNKPNRPWFGRVRFDFLFGPLMLAAAEGGNTKRLISALEYIQNIDYVDDRKETALHKAANGGHHDTVQLLLMKGASIEAMDRESNTPLHHAARHGDVSTVELLLERSTSIEAKNIANSTPLHLAAQSGHVGVVELLLGKGAPIEAVNKANDTSLHLAAQGGHTGVVELLLEKGAPTEAKNIYNNTPLHLAMDNHHLGIERLLVEKAVGFARGQPQSIQAYDTTLQRGRYGEKLAISQDDEGQSLAYLSGGVVDTSQGDEDQSRLLQAYDTTRQRGRYGEMCHPRGDEGQSRWPLAFDTILQRGRYAEELAISQDDEEQSRLPLVLDIFQGDEDQSRLFQAYDTTLQRGGYGEMSHPRDDEGQSRLLQAYDTTLQKGLYAERLAISQDDEGQSRLVQAYDTTLQRGWYGEISHPRGDGGQ